QCRKAFVLRKVYGYSQKEIADSLGISENTVEKHIATGIKRCTGYMMARKAGDLHDVSRQSVSNSQMADEPSHEEAPMAKAGDGHEEGGEVSQQRADPRSGQCVDCAAGSRLEDGRAASPRRLGAAES